MLKGWITLHRKLQETPMWLNDPFSRGQAWVDLLLLANHAKGYIRINGERIDIERGQLGRSILTLSKRWKWSRGKTTRFLKELEKDKQITLKTNIKNSTITICNYDVLQPTRTTSGTPSSTTNGHQVVQQTDTNNKEEEIINNKNKKNKKNNKENISDFPDWLPIEAWEAFLEMRKKKKEPPTPYAEKLLLARLTKFKDAGLDVREIINNSIMNNWRGFYDGTGKRTSNRGTRTKPIHGNFGEQDYTAGTEGFS